MAEIESEGVTYADDAARWVSPDGDRAMGSQSTFCLSSFSSPCPGKMGKPPFM